MSGKRNRNKKSNSKFNPKNYTYNPSILSEITQQSLKNTAPTGTQQSVAPVLQPNTPVPPKYYLTNDVIDIDGHKLHRIIAARDIPEINVKKGQLGGYIESERNLSHRGTAWVFQTIKDNKTYDGKVYEQASVIEGATVRGEARVHGKACLSGQFAAYDEAHLYGNFRGTGYGKAAGNVDARDNTMIKGSGCATDSVQMRDNAIIGSNARASAGAILTGTVELTGDFDAIGGRYSQGVMGRFAEHTTEQPEYEDTWNR